MSEGPRLLPGPAAIVSAFRRTVARTGEAWKTFLEAPGEEAGHKLRTSIRRAEAAARVLPRTVRSRGNTRRFLVACKETFDAVGAARDLEVVAARIGELSHVEGVAPPLGEEALRFSAVLRREAAQKAEEAYDVTDRVRPSHLPHLGRRRVDGAKLRRRYRKVVSRMVAEARETLRVALAAPGGSEAAHQARRACKRLRYTLELARRDEPERHARNLGDLEGVLRWLGALQDHIGALHDLDMAIARLRDEGRNGLLKVARAARLARFHDLVRFVREEGDVLGPLAVRL